jgi:hypothetical protein
MFDIRQDGRAHQAVLEETICVCRRVASSVDQSHTRTIYSPPPSTHTDSSHWDASPPIAGDLSAPAPPYSPPSSTCRRQLSCDTKFGSPTCLQSRGRTRKDRRPCRGWRIAGCIRSFEYRISGSHRRWCQRRCRSRRARKRGYHIRGRVVCGRPGRRWRVCGYLLLELWLGRVNRVTAVTGSNWTPTVMAHGM